MYRVRGNREIAPVWWLNLSVLHWPEPLKAARLILVGEEAVVDLDTAEMLRRWAVTVPGWPRTTTDGLPLSFEAAGYLDGEGEARRRWPIALHASDQERARIEAAAKMHGLTVGSYLRNLALAADPDGEE